MSENPMPDSRPLLAYKNEPFLQSPDARPLRIISEYLEPLSHLRRQRIRDTVVFFGSARIQEDGPLGSYYKDARTLASLVTTWAKTFRERTYRFVVCSGGGPGIMEAANRGASDARGKNIGLNIGLPFEQFPNPYITRELSFEFHYFFMRKFWFAYMAKALVVFPGGFGTMDELFEILTLVQTRKIAKKITIILYGTAFWKEVVNFEALVKYGTISPDDMNLFHFADTPESALEILQRTLTEQIGTPEAEVPAIAPSVKPDEPIPSKEQVPDRSRE
ncbi:MAG TPA: TIGR00730 family Rossman fold protein [Bryobacteraceae bacterium]|nr:TIGR00730 family Rossman fold protein [Bryobacteraceae bacterium]